MIFLFNETDIVVDDRCILNYTLFLMAKHCIFGRDFVR